MKEVTLTLTLDQVNLTLKALAKQPYETVATTIESIHQQSREQLEAKTEENKS